MIAFYCLILPLIVTQGDVIELKSADAFTQKEGAHGVVQQLNGNVHLHQDSLDIFCESALYDARRNSATLRTDVVLVHNDLTLKSHNVLYNGNTEIATSPVPFAMFQDSSLLSAHSGRYNVGTSVAHFQDSVVVENTAMLLTGQSLLYNRLTERTLVGGTVVGELNDNNVRFAGDTAVYTPAEQTLELIGNAQISELESHVSDSTAKMSTTIRAQRVSQVVRNGDTVRTAQGAAVLQHNDIIVSAEQMTHFVSKRIVTISDSVTFWLPEGYGKAGSIRIEEYAPDSTRITAQGNVFIALNEQTQSTEDIPYHQLVCDSMNLDLYNKSVVQLRAFYNTQSVFIVVENAQEIGRQKTVSDALVIDFEAGNPVYVDWQGEARGEVTPPHLATSSTRALSRFIAPQATPTSTMIQKPHKTVFHRQNTAKR